MNKFCLNQSQNALLNEELLERISVKLVLVRNQFQDASQVDKEIALVAICKNGRYTCRFKLEVQIMDLDEVDSRVGAD